MMFLLLTAAAAAGAGAGTEEEEKKKKKERNLRRRRRGRRRTPLVRRRRRRGRRRRRESRRSRGRRRVKSRFYEAHCIPFLQGPLYSQALFRTISWAPDMDPWKKCCLNMGNHSDEFVSTKEVAPKSPKKQKRAVQDGCGSSKWRWPSGSPNSSKQMDAFALEQIKELHKKLDTFAEQHLQQFNELHKKLDAITAEFKFPHADQNLYPKFMYPITDTPTLDPIPNIPTNSPIRTDNGAVKNLDPILGIPTNSPIRTDNEAVKNLDPNSPIRTNNEVVKNLDPIPNTIDSGAVENLDPIPNTTDSGAVKNLDPIPNTTDCDNEAVDHSLNTTDDFVKLDLNSDAGGDTEAIIRQLLEGGKKELLQGTACPVTIPPAHVEMLFNEQTQMSSDFFYVLMWHEIYYRGNLPKGVYIIHPSVSTVEPEKRIQYVAHVDLTGDFKLICLPIIYKDHWSLVVLGKDNISHFDSRSTSKPAEFKKLAHSVLHYCNLRAFRWMTCKWSRPTCPCQYNTLLSGWYTLYFMIQVIYSDHSTAGMRELFCLPINDGLPSFKKKVLGNLVRSLQKQ